VLLHKFKWGRTFYEVNEEALEMYAACTDSAAVVAAQKLYLEKITGQSTLSLLALVAQLMIVSYFWQMSYVRILFGSPPNDI